jgi:hypothetical protein
MVEHICPNCNYKFSKKSRLNEHLKKKNACNINIQNYDVNLTDFLPTQKPQFPAQKPQFPTQKPQFPTQNTHKIKINSESDLLNEPNNNTLIENISNLDSNSNSNLICKYCSKLFCRNDVLTRHIKYYCKVKKHSDQEKKDIFEKLLLQESLLKEKDTQIHKLMSQNDVLINKINILEEKVDKISNVSNIIKPKTNKTVNNISMLNNTTNTANTNNTTNTTNTNNGVILQLVNYGKENLSTIDIKHFIKNIVKNNKASGVKIPEEILKLIHFNPEYPELNNIYISDINREKCMIYDDGMWKLSPDDKIPEVIDKVVSFSYEKENELREKFSDNKPLMDRLNTINKYIKLNDNEYLQILKDEEPSENKDEIKRCENFKKKTYNTFKTTMYNEGIKLKKKQNKIKKINFIEI